MIFSDKTGFLSPEFNIGNEAIVEAHVTITGPGPVYIEQKGEDGVWRTFPEMTFTESAAYIMSLRGAPTRIYIDGVTTVEFNV